jgi:hypothetical protein
MSELKCLVELNKEEGILIKLKNPDAGIVQTIILNGKSIVTTCKDNSETSTITQKPDSIAIKCKTYTVDAETIEMSSKKTTKHKSGGDMSLQSDSNLSAKASSDFKTKASSTTISSDMSTKIEGLEVKVEASTEAKVSGSAMVKISGGIVKLQ